jgi:hypothetical protein
MPSSRPSSDTCRLRARGLPGMFARPDHARMKSLSPFVFLSVALLFSSAASGRAEPRRVLDQSPQVLMAEAPIVGVDDAAPYNELILRQIASMPDGGGYATTHQAKVGLFNAVQLNPLGFSFDEASARPSFCSGATYLVFLKTIEAIRRRGELPADESVLGALLVGNQRDGEGIWGRWNANGPGTARLFHQLKLGPNFNDFSKAQHGDFMKIFWTNAVGKHERGHSVIYMGQETLDGVENVRFWSSNTGVGYGMKTVPRKKIAAAIFSRLIAPRNVLRAPSLTPAIDPYLASLLTKDSSLAEAQRNSGM